MIVGAFIKSMRNSVEAALYYLAKMILAGESAGFIARCMVIFASENLGNSNPNALNLANSTLQGGSKNWFSRSLYYLYAIYLSCCPKSNGSYLAINGAFEFVQTHRNNPIY